MSQFLNFKHSDCKNCYKCIRHCPVKSIKFSGDQAEIIGNECILCGQCFVVCPQNAKEITDGIPKAKELLQSSSPVFASIAPSFVANYDGISFSAIKESLLRLGFYDAEETAIGATIVKNEYDAMLKEKSKKVLISSCCHSVNLLIQKYFPTVLGCLADIISPMQAHSLDIKKRYPNAKTIFVGPCIAKKDEADHYSGIVDAVLTYDEFSKWLKAEGIKLSPQEDHCDKGKTRIFPTTGGIIKSMNCDQQDYTYMAIDGMENCMATLRDIEHGEISNCFIEMSACTGSCIGGPVMEKRLPVRDYVNVKAYSGAIDFDVEQLPSHQLKKSISYIGRKLNQPDDIELAAILKQMGKTNSGQELNCGFCGYSTCRDKAVAIYQKKASLSTCLPFLKEKAESFSDNVIHNSPNGIIVLNEQLEVQQINNAAIKILKLRNASDILGEQVIRVLDPKNFLDVKESGRNIREHRVYLAEYDRFVEQTILYDKEYHILICMMRDVTKEEKERGKKDEFDRHTIEIADKVVDKQMRVVQEIASLLGETAAETKIALTKLKESISNE